MHNQQTMNNDASQYGYVSIYVRIQMDMNIQGIEQVYLNVYHLLVMAIDMNIYIWYLHMGIDTHTQGIYIVDVEIDIEYMVSMYLCWMIIRIW